MGYFRDFADVFFLEVFPVVDEEADTYGFLAITCRFIQFLCYLCRLFKKSQNIKY